jgi:cardiolipin synthase
MIWPHLDLGPVYEITVWAIRLGALIVVPFKRRSTAAAWLLFLFILPVPGLLLFLAIGQPRFPRWRIARFLQLRPFFDVVAARLQDAAPSHAGATSPAATLIGRLGHMPAVEGNAIELIGDYDVALGQLVADIDTAHHSVRLLIYIFADDTAGMKVIAALGRAVKRGVKCQVLVDPVGSSPWIKRTLRALEAAGVETREALPFHWLRGRTRLDMRNHRKLFVIDGTIGYAGSQNIVAKNFKKGIVNRELVARCTGPVVLAMEAVILGDWFLETEQPPPNDLPIPSRTGDAVLQLLPSGANYRLEGFETILVWKLHQARERAIIVSPYFIPDEDVLSALKTAAVRGVNIDLVVSKVVDQRLVNLAQRSYYDELLAAGVRIHLFSDFLLHAKNASIDGTIGVIGSSNVDLRSFQLNEEVSLFLFDKGSVASLEKIQREYLAASDMIILAEWRRRGKRAMFAENLAHLVSPLL